MFNFLLKRMQSKKEIKKLNVGMLLSRIKQRSIGGWKIGIWFNSRWYEC